MKFVDFSRVIKKITRGWGVFGTRFGFGCSVLLYLFTVS